MNTYLIKEEEIFKNLIIFFCAQFIIILKTLTLIKNEFLIHQFTLFFDKFFLKISNY